jgi:glycosyltransferase involved in cell wall biosynthesis
MKIVLFDYVCDPAKPGASGLSDIQWNMAVRLRDLGDEVHVVGPYTTDQYPDPAISVHRFAIPPLGYRNIYGHLLIVLAGWREVRKLGRIDLIHTQEYLSSGLLSLLARDVPVILTVPGNVYAHRQRLGRPYLDNLTDPVLMVAARVSAKRCARVIATTSDERWWWEHIGAPEERIHVIPHGVDTELFRRIPDARQRLGIGDNARVVLYVGRLLTYYKGLDYLIRAIAELRSQVPKLELHMIGNGPDRDNLARLAVETGCQDSVIFHDWVEPTELPLYYSAADVTVLSSNSEGFPRVIPESMACGSAFLGTEVAGTVDLIRDDETGFVVPPRDAKALAEKIRWALENRAALNSVAERGTRLVREQLDWGTIVLRIREEVYYSVV